MIKTNRSKSVLNHLITQTNNVELRFTMFPCSSERKAYCDTHFIILLLQCINVCDLQAAAGHVATDASGILASGGIVPMIHLMGRLAVCCCLTGDFECPTVCAGRKGGGGCTVSEMCSGLSGSRGLDIHQNLSDCLEDPRCSEES